MDPTGFLILSDIHFGELAEHADFARPGTDLAGKKHYRRVSMMKSLLNVVSKYKARIKYLLVPGDLTSKADPDDFCACKKAILEIADAAAIAKSHVFCTFGNHDTNWLVAKLTGQTLDLNQPQGYHLLASSVGATVVPDQSRIEAGPVVGSGRFKDSELDLIVANSGLFCIDSSNHKHGRLGDLQLGWLKDQLLKPRESKWRVVMIHHHPFNYPYPVPIHDVSTLEEGDHLVSLMAAGNVDVVCHGHRHHPRLFTRMDSGFAAPVTFFCGGSVSVNHEHRNDGDIPNCFHLMFLSERSNVTRAAIGTVHTYRFKGAAGWVPNEWSEDAPLDYRHTFGSTASRMEIAQDGDAIVRAALTDAKGSVVALPSQENFPLSLRCLSEKELRKELDEAAGRAGTKLFRDSSGGLFLKTGS